MRLDPSRWTLDSMKRQWAWSPKRQLGCPVRRCTPFEECSRDALLARSTLDRRSGLLLRSAAGVSKTPSRSLWQQPRVLRMRNRATVTIVHAATVNWPLFILFVHEIENTQNYSLVILSNLLSNLQCTSWMEATSTVQHNVRHS